MLDTSPASPIDDSLGKNSLNVSTASTDSGLSSDGVRPTDQLTYLAQILGFKVRSSDILKRKFDQSMIFQSNRLVIQTSRKAITGNISH